jgi:hypothetical protein
MYSCAALSRGNPRLFSMRQMGIGFSSDKTVRRKGEAVAPRSLEQNSTLKAGSKPTHFVRFMRDRAVGVVNVHLPGTRRIVVAGSP